MDRRTFVGCGAAGLISCSQSQGEYFGRTGPTTTPKLVCSLLAEPFSGPGIGNPTGWTDPTNSSVLADANRTLNPQERLTKLAECEKRLLRAMPFVPLYFDAWAYLQKPFVKDLNSNLLGNMRAFKYAWIDTNWRPS